MLDEQRTNACPGGTSCPTYPCQVCWSTPICQKSSTICQRDGDSFISMIIDVIGILIFFVFMMLQFWFKVTTYIFRGCRAFYCADRVVQIALSIVGLLVLSSSLVHVFLGTRSYNREQLLMKKNVELQLCKAGKLGKAGSVGPAGAAGAVGATTAAKAAVAKKQLQELIKPLKITLQYPKQFKNIPLNVTKVFTVMILDEKKKKIYESQQDVQIPEKERPPLVMAMQPIIINNYQ